ncbi:MAG: hypothetical protein H0U94_00435, partial [Acidobacteria bacterium]|nr:hypothetical protein [Acidobacteriota bacterium]
FYELAGGSARSAPKEYALAAALATGIAIAGATALLAGSHGRLIRMALETPGDRHGRFAHLHGRVEPLLAALTRDQVQRAIAGFTLRTLLRSRAHLMLLATYLGVGAALVVSVLLPQFLLRGLAAVESPSLPWLSAPLILTFFALCGSRTILAIPADIKANWLFRLHASDSCMPQVVDGARAALLVAVVVPVAAAAGILGVWFWGVRSGGIHGVVTGALGVLLLEVLLVGFRKVPFACTYFPGRSRVRTMWPIYGLAFSVYAFSLAALEAAALVRPVLLVPMLAVIAGVTSALRFASRRDLQPPPGLTYEESDPDGLFQGFRLSEGMAAESAATLRR